MQPGPGRDGKALRPAAADTGGSSPIRVEEFSFTPRDGQARVTGWVPPVATGRRQLVEADRVVAGGRGVAGDFGLVEALADALGGAVGASRAAVNAGWVPSSIQVGQTGKSVSPQLYVALGISGAIQHTAGMRTARRIVPVNQDPDAPIHRLADLSVGGRRGGRPDTARTGSACGGMICGDETSATRPCRMFDAAAQERLTLRSGSG